MLNLNRFPIWYYIAFGLFAIWLYRFGEELPSLALYSIFLLFIGSISILAFDRSKPTIDWPKGLVAKIAALVSILGLVNLMLPGAGYFEVAAQLLVAACALGVIFYKHSLGS